MPTFDSAQVKKEIISIYKDAKKKQKFVPPSVARAMALANISGGGRVLTLKKNKAGMYS